MSHANERLTEWLLTRFSPGQLDRFLASSDETHRIRTEVVQPLAASPRQYTFDVVEEMARVSVIDESFFVRALQHRPRDEAIQDVAALFDVDHLRAAGGSLKPRASNHLALGAVEMPVTTTRFLEIGSATQRVHVLLANAEERPARRDSQAVRFDLTNLTTRDLRVVHIYVDAVQRDALGPIARVGKTMGLARFVPYTCVVDQDLRLYPSRLDVEDRYLRLEPGRLETFDIAVASRAEGMYRLKVVVDYSAGGEVGTFEFMLADRVHFLDRERLDALPKRRVT